MQREFYNKPVYIVALMTAVATFPLIFMGGLVTSHGAGMSVPDWPNTWGYNMFTFPVSKWVGGIRFEHTHRLAGTFVGMLSIVLLAVAWIKDSRRWVRWNAVGIFIAVSIQGLLGALRVVRSDPRLAIIHGCVAQLFFCYIATYCVLTSKFWATRYVLTIDQSRTMRRIVAIGLGTVSVIAMQLAIGAIMRHNDAGLAIPDFPTSYGHWLPPTAITAEFRQEAIHRYGFELGLGHVTLFQIWIHFAHRLGAVLVTTMIAWLSWTILRTRHALPIRPLAWTLLGLVAAQITLGILTVLLRKPADIASLHVAVGALILMSACVIVVRTYGLVTAPSERGEMKSTGAFQYAEASR